MVFVPYQARNNYSPMVSSGPSPTSNTHLRSIVGATFIWKLGDGVIATALGYVALVATGSSFWVGVQYAVSLATASIAAALLGRWMDCQRLIALVRVGSVTCLLAIAVVALSPETTDSTVVGVLVATGLVSVSFVLLSVALTAAVAAVVPPDRLLFGSTAARSAQLTARALGGLLLSLLLFTAVPGMILGIAALLACALWIVCERVLRPLQYTLVTEVDSTSALRVFATAVREFVPQRLVLGMLICYGVFVSPFVALLPVIATEITGNSKNVGWLSAVYFAGGTVSVVSGYVSTRINIPLSARALMSCGLSGLWLMAIASCIMFASGTVLVVLGAVFTFLLGHANTMLLTVFNVAAQDFSPDHHRRRILSALIVLGSAVGTAAVLVAGWWSTKQGLDIVLLCCAFALLSFALVQLRWHRAINVAPIRASAR